MKKIFVQIYEVQTPAEAEKLMALGTDHIGSVVVSAEKWKVPSIRETIRVIAGGTARSSVIPLFSDNDLVLGTLDYYRPDMVHFCEALPLETDDQGACKDFLGLQESVKERFPEINIMRSIPIAPPGMSGRVPTLELARLFEPVSDYFMTDTFLLRAGSSGGDRQPVEGFVGITGQTCDWDVAAELVRTSRIPVILAGGISPENVFDGIRHTRPAGVDSCTGTNAVDSEGRSIRFKKDLEKVRRMIAEVRRAGQMFTE